MAYKTEKRNSTGTEVIMITGKVHRLIGFIKQVSPDIYSADRGPYQLGTFPSVDGAKEAIIHEFERPLSIEQADAWNNRTGIYNAS